MHSINFHIAKFLRENCQIGKRYLVALSGGPDSLALLYVLLQVEPKVKIAIAHVDHGWREESAEEASLLEQLANQEGLVFHLKRLTLPKDKGNLEAICRLERLKFFKQLCQDEGYAAVFTGHHADDQAECVLKRLFEGASLNKLRGMHGVQDFEGMTLLRPLLHFTKTEIQALLNQFGKKGFEDSTNKDMRFLRSRLREQLLPTLTSQFGKNVAGNLVKLGEESEELENYLKLRLEPILQTIEAGSRGLFLDLSNHDLQPLELRYLLRHLGTFSREELTLAATLIRENATGKQVGPLRIDRRRLFISKDHNPNKLISIDLDIGVQQWGPWKIELKKETGETRLGWQAVWQGDFAVALPEGKISIQPLSTLNYDKEKLSKCWSSARVPIFLRHQSPLIFHNHELFAEVLTGRFNSCKNDLRWSAKFIYQTLENESLSLLQ